MNPNPTTVADQLASLFTTTADNLARETGFVQRRSKLGGSEMARTLVFGWLHQPQATLEELAQCANALGVSISPQGLDQRFGKRAAAFLERLLQQAVLRVIGADPVAIPLLQRFPGGVCLLDSTSITLPPAFAHRWRGCGVKPGQKGAGIKAQVRLNLSDGTLTGPVLYPGCASDYAGERNMPPLAAGALRLADTGFFSIEWLQKLDKQKAYWITRLKRDTRFRDSVGQKWSPAQFLTLQQTDMVDVPIVMESERRGRLPCRLVALRAPPAVVAKRHEHLRKEVRRRGKVHPDHWLLAEWTFFITNVAPECLSVKEVWVLARCRWQIELLFKLWKSEGQVDESRSSKPWRILCEVYAKLLGMVMQHWLLLVGCWTYPDRSLVKASRTVRRTASSLALVLPQRQLVYGILIHLQQCLKRGCRINRRRRAPPTHQILLGLAKAG